MIIVKSYFMFGWNKKVMEMLKTVLFDDAQN